MTVAPVTLPVLADTFRCVQFACTLSHRACLSRQQERRRQWNTPVYEYCAEKCEQGRGIAALFPGFDAAAPVERKPPRLDLVHAAPVQPEPQEAEMAAEKTCPYCFKKLRSDNSRGACSDCLAKGMDKRSAAKVEASSPPPAPPRKAARAKPEPAGGFLADLRSLSTTDLRELLGAVQAEVRRRVQELEELRGLVPEEREAA